MTRLRRASRTPVALVLAFITFVLVLAFLVAGSLFRPDVPEFDPSTRARGSVIAATVLDTVTIDASDAATWRFFDLTRGLVTAPPDTSGWDLAFRRFHVMTAGSAADLGAVSFDSVIRTPDRDFHETELGRDTVNPVLAKWYDYSPFSHVLQSKGHVYVIRDSDGHFTKVEFLSYYCTGAQPGCVTLRYARLPARPISESRR